MGYHHTTIVKRANMGMHGECLDQSVGCELAENIQHASISTCVHASCLLATGDHHLSYVMLRS